ncbi:MAG: DUF4738 domain-containing protein [Bacteroides sp.]|nr:DUF4738 domain-containing protein [Bacteroides sp.]
MRKLLAGLFLVSLVVTACGKKQEEGIQKDEEVLMQNSSSQTDGAEKMQPFNSALSVNYKNKEYTLQISRTPDENLSKVKSASGTVFIDNRISLFIRRGNETIFNKEFTKDSFSSLIDAGFLKNAILEGMVYDRTTDKGIVFASSVCYPQTDLYYPVSVTITPDGKMGMVKEELLEDIFAEEE